MHSARIVTILLGVAAASPAAAQTGTVSSSPSAGAPARRPTPLDSTARARYLGQYTLVDSASGGETPLRVFEQGGALFGQIRTNTPTRFVFLGEDAFRPAAAPDVTITFTVAEDRATAAVIRGPGVLMRGARSTGDVPRTPASPRVP